MKKFLLLLTVHCSLLTVCCSLFSNAQTDSSYKFLDINDVKARINSCGMLFWDLKGLAEYEVPKGSGKTSNFSSTLWIGGKDKNGKLHLAGERYRQVGHDYAYGPVRDSIDYKNYKKWENTWKINKSTIDSFKTYWSTPAYKIPASILNWPANGDTTLGQSRRLAPYFDNDNDGYYNPAKGDYPLIRGDQAVYFIINDDSIHTETGGVKLKVEVHGMAYAFNEPADSALYPTIFLNYQIINHSQNNYDSLYIGIFDDTDIGWAWDDFTGCDTLLNSFYTYNGKDTDGTGQAWAYGGHPPALSVTFLNNKMNAFIYFNNSADVLGDPVVANEYYNYMKAIWKDSTHLLFGGCGHIGCTGITNKKTNYMFPGNPADTTQWTEISAKNTPYDRRGLGSIGPISFNKGETKCIDIAYVWARDYTGNNISSVTLLKQRIAAIQDFYNNKIASNCDDITINAVNNLNGINNSYIKVFPNPADNYIIIETKTNFNTSSKYVLTLRNIEGQEVLSKNVTFTNTYKLDLTNLTNGMYILTLQNDKENYVRKVVVQK